MKTSNPVQQSSFWSSATVLVLALLVLVFAIGHTAAQQQMPPLTAALLVFFALTAVVFLIGFLRACLIDGEWPSVEGHWGGLGGGATGWRLSPSLIWLLGSALLLFHLVRVHQIWLLDRTRLAPATSVGLP